MEVLEVFIMKKYRGSKIYGNIFDVYSVHVGYKFCKTHRKKISVVMKKCFCGWSEPQENSVQTREFTKCVNCDLSLGLCRSSGVSSRTSHDSVWWEGRTFWKEAPQSKEAGSRLPSALSLAQGRLQTHS